MTMMMQEKAAPLQGCYYQQSSFAVVPEATVDNKSGKATFHKLGNDVFYL